MSNVTQLYGSHCNETCEDEEEDKVGWGLPPDRLAAGHGDQADQHHAHTCQVHPHVPLHIPRKKQIKLSFKAKVQCNLQFQK